MLQNDTTKTNKDETRRPASLMRGVFASFGCHHGFGPNHTDTAVGPLLVDISRSGVVAEVLDFRNIERNGNADQACGQKYEKEDDMQG